MGQFIDNNGKQQYIDQGVLADQVAKQKALQMLLSKTNPQDQLILQALLNRSEGMTPEEIQEKLQIRQQLMGNNRED